MKREFDTLGRLMSNIGDLHEVDERIEKWKCAQEQRARERAREEAELEAAFQALEEKLVEAEVQKIKDKYR